MGKVKSLKILGGGVMKWVGGVVMKWGGGGKGGGVESEITKWGCGE